MTVKRRYPITIAVLILTTILLAGCNTGAAVSPAPQSDPTLTPVTLAATAIPTTAAIAEAPAAPTVNMSDGCVTDFDASVDYFPEKAVFEQVQGVTLEYHNHYKIITVTNPWKGADTTFQYLLVQCGTPTPEGFDEALVIEIPVKSVVAMSATHLPHLESLEVAERLVGYDDFTYISSPAIRARADAGDLVETGSGATLNIEAVLDLEPELVMTFGVGLPEYDSHPALLEAGIPTVLNSEYMEISPLARSEWLKFTAAFFNREALATTLYDAQVQRYTDLATLTADVTERPTVFTGLLRGDAWSVPYGGYLATFLADAGAEYLWAEDIKAGTVGLDFEAAFDRAATADYWLNTSTWVSQADALTADERYANFAAFQNGRLYNNNARLNEFGANDYFGSGVMNPDVILADLIFIFHPELLPDHTLVYYHALGEAAPTP